jgi:hypothetical protein
MRNYEIADEDVKLIIGVLDHAIQGELTKALQNPPRQALIARLEALRDSLVDASK